jgi:hypothetical protein
VVDVANGADVNVWFGPIEFLFRHDSSALASLRPGFVPASVKPKKPGCRFFTAAKKNPGFFFAQLELMTGIEPVTSSLPRTCSTY